MKDYYEYKGKKIKFSTNFEDCHQYKKSTYFICKRCNSSPVDTFFQFWTGKKHNKIQVCVSCLNDLTGGNDGNE